MTQELVSLIVPIYNGENYIARFYTLFNRQNYPHIELILIDDGSIDATAEMLDKLANCDERLIVCHKENGGVSAARNLGISKAKGQYIAFADVDDYIYPDYIQYMWQLLKKTDADMAFCSYLKMLDKEDYERQRMVKENKILLFNREDAIEKFCYRKYLTGYSYLKLVKSSIAKDILFDEEIAYGEDFLYTYELLNKCSKVAFGNEIQYVYIQYETSATHLKRDNTLKYWKAWKRHVDFINDVQKKFPRAYLGAISKCYVLAINNTTRVYDKKRDRQFLNEMYDFIGQNAKKVFNDRKAKKITRMLGFAGMINVKLMCVCCQLFFKTQEKLGITFRRTV